MVDAAPPDWMVDFAETAARNQAWIDELVAKLRALQDAFDAYAGTGPWSVAQIREATGLADLLAEWVSAGAVAGPTPGAPWVDELEGKVAALHELLTEVVADPLRFDHYAWDAARHHRTRILADHLAPLRSTMRD